MTCLNIGLDCVGAGVGAGGGGGGEEVEDEA